ncbi:MAG TPA: TrkA C-terminal domain-containing protein, partial [Bacilli bacterium]|nr:TrkA C-terminal domain-containing protein [Bacilli bacterium]
GGNYSVVKITIREDFVPIQILALDARNQFGINIILIQRGHKMFAPRAADTLSPKDIIHVVGTRRDIEDFGDFINREPSSIGHKEKKPKRTKRKE